MNRGPLRSHARPRGFAIVLVLWLMVLLSAIGIHLTSVGRTELRIASNIAASAQAEALADGGIAEAVFWLGDSNPERRWRADGEPHRLLHGRDRLTVTVNDESGKVNPNLAPEQLTAVLLREIGAEQDVAGAIAAAIAARVQPSSSSTPSATASAPPALAGMPPSASTSAATAPANAPQRQQMKFETLEELLDLPGMTSELYARLRPHISIDTTASLPNGDAADPTVSHALAAFRSLGGTEGQAELSRGNAAPTQGQAPTILSIVSAANDDDGATFIREAVVRLDPKVPKGFIALRWTRRELDDSGSR